ncbi:radical SAM protein [Candidatus Micrarchaeota archaeon]|nr:radical SAM protein [Candidatus Micrarchaeota archaeon]
MQDNPRLFFPSGVRPSQIPKGIGALLKGWDVPENHFRDPDRLPLVDFRAMTSACRWNCFHCFTDKQKKSLTLQEIKSVIDQLADMRAWAINYLGEGEPTLDKDFFDIVEYTSAKGIQPVIFSDAATRLRDRDFVRRLYESGSTLLPKCDSLFDEAYQNWIVGDRGGGYFSQRNEAIAILIDEGFNSTSKDGTTRLGFDMVLSARNVHEVEQTLRFCRENNIWIVFSFFLPAGRSNMADFDRSLMLSPDEKKRIREIVAEVDAEYGVSHEALNNFLTHRCVEFMCIYGDGRVSPCPGNEEILGNIKLNSIREISRLIVEKHPRHERRTFDGNCPYRERF